MIVYGKKIAEEIKKYFPGSAALEKAIRADILEYIFNTRSWKAIENMDLLLLETALKQIRHILPQYDGEKTFKAFIDKANTDTPKEKVVDSDGCLICPNTEKMIEVEVCKNCNARKGCPAHESDIDQ